MEFNSLIFPAPKPTYSNTHPNLIFIPSTINKDIPCWFLKSDRKSNKIIIYFHGNAEDLGNSFFFMKKFINYFNYNVIIVEYPSYGIYNYNKPSEDIIFKDAEFVLDFVEKILKFNKNNIIIIGRSIGCSPSIYLASKNLVNSLILISPFTSIRDAASSFVGSSISYLLKDRFLNKNTIKKNFNPWLIIHGKKDEIIPVGQGIEIYQNSPSQIKELKTPNLMTHNKFNWYQDIFVYISDFINKLNTKFVNNEPKLEYLKYFCTKI